MIALTEPLTTTLPLNVEPLTIEVTKNPLSGDTDAVTEPDAIFGDAAAITFDKLEPSP